MVRSAAEALGLPREVMLGEGAASFAGAWSESVSRPTSDVAARDIEWASVGPHDLAALHLRQTGLGDRRKRQASGLYPTPRTLARVMAEEATLRAPRSSRGLPVCLDPACGWGGLLVEAMRALCARFGAGVVNAARALRGFDCDPACVWMARLAIVLAARELGAAREEMERVAEAAAAHIAVREVLEAPPDEQADCLLMNPPYVRAARARADRERIRGFFPTARGAFDLSVPFIEMALRCVRSSGTFAILTTSKLFAAEYARALRWLLAERATLRRVVDLEHCEDARSGALVEQVLLVGTVGRAPDGHRLQFLRPAALADVSRARAGALWRDQADLLRARWPVLRASASEQRTIERMLGGEVRPLNSLALVRGGVRGYDYRRCCEELVEGAGRPEAMRVLTPGNIRAYHALTGGPLRLAGRWWREPVLANRPQVIGERLWRLFGEPKVVVKGVGPGPVAAWRAEPAALFVAVWGVWGDEELLWGALGLLNSGPVAWLHSQQLALARIPGGSLRTPMAWLAQLPVPWRRLAPLAELARLRFRTADPAEEVALQQQIDEAAAQAYDLRASDLKDMARGVADAEQA